MEVMAAMLSLCAAERPLYTEDALFFRVARKYDSQNTWFPTCPAIMTRVPVNIFGIFAILG